MTPIMILLLWRLFMPFGLISGLFSNITNAMMNRENNRLNYFLNQDNNEANWRITQAVNAAQMDIARQTNEANVGMVRDTNLTNERLVGQTNAQNRELQHEAWRREDNAVQRRAADMRSAGINPILAAGNPAQAGAPITLQAPQHEAPQNRHMANLQAAQMRAARMEASRIETDIVERALRMRDDFATSESTRKVLAATAREHDERSRLIGIEADQMHDSYELRMSQIRSTINSQGAMAALHNVQRETQRLEQKGIVDRNYGYVLDNVRKRVENLNQQEFIDRKLRIEELEIISREIANSMAEHERDIYVSMGTTRSGSTPEKAAQFIINLFKKYGNQSFQMPTEFSNSPLPGNEPGNDFWQRLQRSLRGIYTR